MNKLVQRPDLKLVLLDVEQNVFAILGAFAAQARNEKWSEPEINAVLQAARNTGTFDGCLATIMDYCENGGFGLDEEEEDTGGYWADKPEEEEYPYDETEGDGETWEDDWYDN